MWTILKLFFKNNVFYGKNDVSDVCKVFEGIADSDFMPVLSRKYYVPKPAMITDGLLDLNIKDFKYHRVMKYIEIPDLPCFFAGGYDFEKKSSICFGQYIYADGIGKYRFADNAGIYAIILSNKVDDHIDRIWSRVGEMRDFCEIERIETDQMSECVGEGSSRYWMLLGALDTRRYSQQLEKLLDGSFYQLGRKQGQSGMLILPGACFKEKIDGLADKMALLEMFL